MLTFGPSQSAWATDLPELAAVASSQEELGHNWNPKPGMWSWSRHLGLKTISRRTQDVLINPQRLDLISVSEQYVSVSAQ